MPSSPNQRTKLLYLQKILLEKTDEHNPITMKDIIAELAAYDIHAERKSIYNDLEILQQYGLDVEVAKGKVRGYYSKQHSQTGLLSVKTPHALWRSASLGTPVFMQGLLYIANRQFELPELKLLVDAFGLGVRIGQVSWVTARQSINIALCTSWTKLQR